MRRPQERAWDITVPRPIRELASRAAAAEGLREGAYVEELIRADLERRGWPVPPRERPLSLAAQVRAWIRAQAPRGVGALEVMAALAITSRLTVDAILSRSVAKGQLKRVAGGYSAPAQG